MGNNAPIGAFDSGIGGLTVVKELLKLMPGENIIYFGDTLRTPYGSRPTAEILQFMRQILRFFLMQNIKMAVFACNTMTVLGLDMARAEYPFQVVGVNTGARSALKVSKNRHIGIIATQATVDSNKHCKAVQAFNAEVSLYSQACPKFVPFIESEKFVSPELKEAAEEYLAPLKAAQTDTLILGCTHYPYISPLISNIMGSGVKLIDPARDTAADARAMLAHSGQLSDLGRGQARFCFSADIERAERLAKMIIDAPLPEFEIINLADFDQ